MKKKIQEQIVHLEKYGIKNYEIKNDVITINGSLDLSSLTSVEQRTLKANTIQLQPGYNKKQRHCFFDGILRKVKRVDLKKRIPHLYNDSGICGAKRQLYCARKHGKKSDIGFGV